MPTPSDQAFWRRVLRHLVEVSEGECSIDDSKILSEEKVEHQEVLTGILCLYEELEMHKAESNHANEELRQLTESLEATVAERTEELSTHLELLKSTRSQLVHAGKLAALGELVAGIAHELNTPLLVVKGYNEQISELLDRKEQVDREDIGKMLAAIDRSAERMKRVVSNLTDFSRRSEPERKVVDLHVAIQNACSLVGEQLRTGAIRVEQELCSEPPQVIGDVLELEQVFVNLLTNARDAIRSADHSTPGRIVVRTRRQGERVYAEVQDNGPGIPDEIRSNLFEAFFTTKPVGSGTGLGLSISNTIIHDHGGSIAVQSSLGQGSTFRIELPLTDAQPDK